MSLLAPFSFACLHVPLLCSLDSSLIPGKCSLELAQRVQAPPLQYSPPRFSHCFHFISRISCFFCSRNCFRSVFNWFFFCSNSSFVFFPRAAFLCSNCFSIFSWLCGISALSFSSNS